MASYAMCHMKLDMMLRETGYQPSTNPPRLSVWLTNALEPGEREVRDLFFTALADEARGASDVKRNKPIMCVVGNPPYSGESANKGEWIMTLMDAYKKEPGGKLPLKEKNSKWINKDEHKFIRLAEQMIQRSGAGVVGLITSHGYLSDPTLRGMRWHLLKSFDRIYVLDLHGNSNRKEVSPDGSSDKNVFDIMQGVAILIAVKNPAKATLSGQAEVLHRELWGSREAKNTALWQIGPLGSDWTNVDLRGPQWAFLNRSVEVEELFGSGFALNKLYRVFGNGIVTKRDALCIQPSVESVWNSLEAFADDAESTVRARYKISADVRDWRYAWAKADAAAHFDRSYIRAVNYRPFDQRWMLYTGNARGFVGWPVKQVMGHYVNGPNIGLLASKAVRDKVFAHSFVTDLPTEAIFLSGTTGSNAMNFPLYLYTSSIDKPGQEHLDNAEKAARHLNFDPDLYALICKAAGLSPSINTGEDDGFRDATKESRPTEVKVFDYIYGMLHSPVYREAYTAFLKIDFPRIPFPRDPQSFRRVSEAGEALRRLHLMEPLAVGDTPYPYQGTGDDVVSSGYPKLESGRIHINKEQYFASVPAHVWAFYIGGYQPAQKWLKDRRGHKLSWANVVHYQRIVKILVETDRITKELDLPS